MPRLLALVAAAAIILAGILNCLPLLREKAVQKRVQLELEEDLRAERGRARDLEGRIASVKTDPITVEKLAREKFGLARTGEVVFKFRGDLPPPRVAASPPSRSGR
jgi:cell division protein FtsB